MYVYKCVYVCVYRTLHVGLTFASFIMSEMEASSWADVSYMYFSLSLFTNKYKYKYICIHMYICLYIGRSMLS